MPYRKIDHTILGLANDADVLTTNSAWDNVTKAGDGTAKFKTANGAVRLETAAGGGAAQLRESPAASGERAVEVTFAGRPWPTVDMRLVEIRNGTDNGFAARATLTPTGQVRLDNSAGTGIKTTTETVPTSGSWRLYIAAKKGTTTSNGTIQFGIYLTGTGTSEVGTHDITNGNAGTTDIVSDRVGFTSGGPGSHDVLVYQSQDVLGRMGPPAGNPPVLSKSSSLRRFEDYSASTVSGSATLTAVQQSGPSVGTITVEGLTAYWLDATSRTAAVTIRYTVTDANGSTFEDVTYPPITGFGSFRQVLRNGAWE